MNTQRDRRRTTRITTLSVVAVALALGVAVAADRVDAGKSDATASAVPQVTPALEGGGMSSWATGVANIAGTPFWQPGAKGFLSFEDRVEYQRRIEEVYWRHTIWPSESPTPKPELSEVMTADAIRTKVDTYLRKSRALEVYWNRPLTSDQLQAEMDRMARGTRRPDILRELYAALENDPLLVAECLARPALADRLLRDWYAYDDRFHGEVRGRVEAAVASGLTPSMMPVLADRYDEIELRLDVGDDERSIEDAKSVAALDDPVGGDRDRAYPVRLDGAAWEARIRDLSERFAEEATQAESSSWVRSSRPDAARRLETGEASLLPGSEPETTATHLERLPVGIVSRVEEETDGWIVVTVIRKEETSLRLGVASWPKRSFGEWWSATSPSLESITTVAAEEYAAVPETAKAACESPDNWTISEPDAPSGRFHHTAVWTGSRMIVWGGGHDVNTGGLYDPATDTWTPTSVEGAPSGRYLHTAVWTGSGMIVWGGRGSEFEGENLNTGGVYDPMTDTWTPMSTEGAPSGREIHTAVWTGSQMIVWGGYLGSLSLANPTYLNTGGVYDPTTNTWTPTSTEGAPSTRKFHTAVWTGSGMIVWGGYWTDTGDLYDPATDTWTPISTDGAPEPRGGHTAVWTGSRMIVWGGSFLNTGGVYDPATDTWTPTSGWSAPEARTGHTAVWTGSGMIVWGGSAEGGRLNTGGLYDLETDTWTGMTTADAPEPSEQHTAVWTGSQMIVWGDACLKAAPYCPPVAGSGPRFTEGQCGTTMFVEPGSTVAFTVTAEDELDRTLVLDSATLPDGASMNPPLPIVGAPLTSEGDPVTSEFTWSPTSGDAGTVATVTFTATNDRDVAVSCDVTIEVGPGPRFTEGQCGTRLFVDPGGTLTFPVTAEDEPDRTLVLDSALLPDGASMSPPLPVEGNPVTSDFSWTPGIDDASTVRTVTFTATNDLDVAASCDVTIEVGGPRFTGGQCGTRLYVYPSDTLAFPVTVEDELDRTLVLDSSPLPDDASMSPPLPVEGNPVTSDFTWTPGIDDAGTVTTVTFTATNNLDWTAHCGVTIEVGSGPRFTEGPCGTTLSVRQGEAVDFAVTAEDGTDRTLVLDSAPLPGNAYTNPPLPVEGNPVTSHFMWTTTTGDSGTVATVTFTATNDLGMAASCDVTIEVEGLRFTEGQCGTRLFVELGDTLAFPVTAEDVVDRTVVLDSPRLPDGASMSPPLPVEGNPATSDFTWTPEFDDASTVRFVTFTATNDLDMTTVCEMTIEVGSGPRFTEGPCWERLSVDSGDTVAFTVTAEDETDRPLVLDSSPLPAGASMTPPLPVQGNPVTSDFTWTPGIDDAGTVATVTFTATNDFDVAASCDVTIEVSFPPPRFTEGPCGTTLRPDPGDTVAFTVTAEDETDRPLVLDSSPLPAGASMAPPLPVQGNPVTSDFTWTPGIDDASTVRTVTFTATNDFDLAAFCRVTIEVGAGPRFTEGPCGTTLSVDPGDTAAFTVAALDETDRTLVLDSSPLPAGASMTPPLPVQGNPVTSDFTWTPGIDDAGTVTTVTFTATNDLDVITLCGVTIEVSSPPPRFTEGPCGTTLSVDPGDTAAFTVAALDETDGTLVLDSTPLPAGASMTPPLPVQGNPVTSDFTWTPGIDDAGTVTTVTFSATNDLDVTTFCGVTIEVGSGPRFTEGPCGTTFLVEGTDTVAFPVTAEDNEGRTLVLDSSPLPDGASMSPPLPVEGNPVTSDFMWTLGPGDDQTVTTVTFTATNDLDVAVTCDVTIDVRFRPHFTEGPCGRTLRPDPGDTVAFTVTAEDETARTLVLDSSPLPAGAYMTPPLPVQGNPVTSDFTWTTTSADEGTVKTVTFTATNDLDVTTPCDVTIRVYRPTLATLRSFTATPDDGRVALDWTTEAEIDNAGFYLLRRNVVTGRTARLNASLIPARGDIFMGAEYLYVDDTAINGVDYEYLLVDVDLHGNETKHPGVRTVPNPIDPPIKLLSPSYVATVSLTDRPAFDWTPRATRGQTLKLSTDPTFADPAAVVSVAVRGTRVGAAAISELARRAEGQPLYWRVEEPGLGGEVKTSDTFSVWIEPLAGGVVRRPTSTAGPRIHTARPTAIPERQRP